LVAALAGLGYKPEIHVDGAALVGYEGRERPERAHVIIRRVQIGDASNDIGFVRKPDGTFGAVLSEYDRGIGFDEKWLGRVHQAYKEQQTLADAKAKGYIPRARGCANARGSADPASVCCEVNDATETDYRDAGTG